MIKIDDVKLWVILQGIGHVVLSTDQMMSTTACDHWMSGTPVKEMPKRICRKCRARLRHLEPV